MPDADARPPIRVATIGFQGFGNLGDEAVLGGVEALLGSNARTLTVFSGPHPDSIAAFPDARRLVTWRHLPTLKAMRAMRRVELVVLAGGGLFNDHWLGVIPRYAAWVAAARLAGARVAWIGVGVGPIRRRWLRALARLAARISQLVLVRDDESVAELGAPAGVTVIPDPALFLDAPPAGEAANELVLIVRAPTGADAHGAAQLIEALAESGAAAERAGLRPVLVTMAGPRDEPFAASVRDASKRCGIDAPAVEALGPTPEAALARLSRCAAVITIRLHGLLLAALADVPAVAIAYDAKVRLAAERLGLADVVVPLIEVSDGRLMDRLETARSGKRRAIVRSRVAELRAQREMVVARLIEAARGA
jgi:polysaccharide pyruvyl transferase WcaK-like protein